MEERLKLSTDSSNGFSDKLFGNSVENHLLQSWILEFYAGASVCRCDLDVVAKFRKLFREVFGTMDEEFWFGLDALLDVAHSLMKNLPDQAA